LQLTATLSGMGGECWGLGCLRSREANRDTSGAKAHMN